ncbi:prepilin peptidase [Abyssogena phaseoliformis symbiont]|uniref:prepilin peptidase n=1 Tax=Abyssogena phaseoliformis symbiont TaxID=596095 RepID=UPI001915AB8C|nr:prepilin peptidase [Abyssogena phaseoliformis symbiont]
MVISRLPLNINGEDISINSPARSFCPNCGHTLGVLELVPIVSFFSAKRQMQELPSAHLFSISAS